MGLGHQPDPSLSWFELALLKRYGQPKGKGHLKIIKANHIVSWKVTDTQRRQGIAGMTDQSAPKLGLEPESASEVWVLLCQPVKKDNIGLKDELHQGAFELTYCQSQVLASSKLLSCLPQGVEVPAK